MIRNTGFTLYENQDNRVRHFKYQRLKLYNQFQDEEITKHWSNICYLRLPRIVMLFISKEAFHRIFMERLKRKFKD